MLLLLIGAMQSWSMWHAPRTVPVRQEIGDCVLPTEPLITCSVLTPTRTVTVPNPRYRATERWYGLIVPLNGLMSLLVGSSQLGVFAVGRRRRPVVS
jgi:hypothetical protein